MKHQLFATLLTWQMSFFAVSFSFAQQPSGSDSTIQIKLHSQILGQDQELIIHLRRNYDPGKKYPVV